MRNRRIGTLAKSAALLTLCIAAASAIAGCGGQGSSGRTDRSPDQSPGAVSEHPADGSDLSPAGRPTPLSEGAAQQAGDALAAADESNAADVVPNAAGRDSDHRQPDVNGWYAEPPALRGIAIGEREADVKDRFGEPSDTYRLFDPPIAVLEYDGFSVGVDEAGRVQYVEVNRADVPTGIGELAVGGTADEAMTALGEPAQASDTVLLYERDGVSLKLDFDPNTKRIASILLFAEP
jgi:hypothetical protein